MCQISSKLVHAFGLQTSITAECSMGRCLATAVAMATASWLTCRERDGMRPPKFHRNRCIDRRVIAFPTFCNMAAVRHLEFEFCYRILLFWTTHEVNYAVRLSYQNLVSIHSSPPETLRCYNFASLAGKCLTTPPWGVIGGLEPLKFVGHHRNPQKAHPWVTTCHKP